MKKLLLTLFVCIAAVPAVFGQDEWQVFARAGEEFTVETPSKLSYGDGRTDGPRAGKTATYWTRIEQTRIFIASEPIKMRTYFDRIMGFAGSHERSALDAGVPAKRFSRSDEYFEYAVVTAETTARSYVFLIVAAKGNTEAVDRFAGSIKISPSDSIDADAAAPDAQMTIAPEAAESIKASGGFGNGKSLNPAEVAPPVDPMSRPESDNAGVRITSKPRAGYTDLARMLHIDGEVSLRVTFSADGTIGPITVISALPFGLTESAIGAARNIRFEAARRDKKPYSVTKAVVYSFSLY